MYTVKKEGREEAVNEKTIEFTTKLLLRGEHSIETIADIVGVAVSFVEENPLEFDNTKSQ